MEASPSVRSPGDRRVVRVLIAAQTANALGDGGFYVTSALFFSRVVGLSPIQIGAGLTLAWAAGFVLATPLGQLADRVGLRRTAMILSVLTAVALALATLPRSMSMFVAVVCLYAVTQSGSAAVRQALLATLVAPPALVLTRARLQAAVNCGIGLGAVLGGVALLLDTPAAYISVFLLDAVTFLVSAGLLARLPNRPGAPSAQLPPADRWRLIVLRDRPYVAAAAVNAVLYLYMPMLSVLLPLYIVQRTAAPTWTVGAVFVVNTVGVATLQVRAARTVSGLRTAVVAVRRAGATLMLSCAVFAVAAFTPLPYAAAAVLGAAVALQIVGEVQLASGSWEIGFTLADPGRQGQWQGLYSSGIPLARALGPLTLTSLVLSWSGPGWLVLGAVFALAALSMGPVVAWGERTRTSTAPAPAPAVPIEA